MKATKGEKQPAGLTMSKNYLQCKMSLRCNTLDISAYNTIHAMLFQSGNFLEVHL